MDFFISYASADEAIARAIRNRIVNHRNGR